MAEPTSPAGSLALAIAALLLVLGYGLARPSRAREWLAFVSVAVAVLVSGWVALTPRRDGGASEASLR